MTSATERFEPALEASAVGHRYRRRGPWALRDVDLSIPQGSITGLVGPNGAGKSTLIRCWIGFERPMRGSTRVMGIDARRDQKEAVQRVGYVSQSGGLYRGLSVSSHLDLAETLRQGFDRALAAERLKQLDIPLAKSAGELSGGEQAQVALSIALGTRAPVFLLDEPLASLDPLARHDFLRILVDEVRARRATALLSSHVVSDLQAACDSLIVLNDGVVRLHASIAAALAEHRLSPTPAPPHADIVASFARPGGQSVVLLRSTDSELPEVTLAELVMGHLAASRPSRAEREESGA